MNQRYFIVEVGDKDCRKGYFLWDGLAINISDRILIKLDYCGYCKSYIRQFNVLEKILYNLKLLKREAIQHKRGFDYFCEDIQLNFSICEIELNEFVRIGNG